MSSIELEKLETVKSQLAQLAFNSGRPNPALQRKIIEISGEIMRVKNEMSSRTLLMPQKKKKRMLPCP